MLFLAKIMPIGDYAAIVAVIAVSIVGLQLSGVGSTAVLARYVARKPKLTSLAVSQIYFHAILAAIAYSVLASAAVAFSLTISWLALIAILVADLLPAKVVELTSQKLVIEKHLMLAALLHMVLGLGKLIAVGGVYFISVDYALSCYAVFSLLLGSVAVFVAISLSGIKFSSGLDRRLTNRKYMVSLLCQSSQNEIDKISMMGFGYDVALAVLGLAQRLVMTVVTILTGLVNRLISTQWGQVRISSQNIARHMVLLISCTCPLVVAALFGSELAAEWLGGDFAEISNYVYIYAIAALAAPIRIYGQDVLTVGGAENVRMFLHLFVLVIYFLCVMIACVVGMVLWLPVLYVCMELALCFAVLVCVYKLIL